MLRVWFSLLIRAVGSPGSEFMYISIVGVVGTACKAVALAVPSPYICTSYPPCFVGYILLLLLDF